MWSTPSYRLLRKNGLNKRDTSSSLSSAASRPKQLLRQPGGFEGFLVIPEELQHHHLALSQSQDRGGSLISLDARLNARQVHSRPHDHDGPGVDYLLDHHLLAHSLRPAVKKGEGCGLPEVNALRPALGHSEDNVVVHQLRKRVGIAPVPLHQRLAHDLDVLLRNKRLLAAKCLLLLVGAGPCPLRVSIQRRSGPRWPCAFHLSWV